MDAQFVLLLRLLAAHLLADFAIQPLLESHLRRSEGRGRADRRTYIHASIAALLAYLLGGRWSAWWLLPVVFLVHVVSDAAGPGARRTDVSFLDQAGHVIVLLIVWYALLGPNRGVALTYSAGVLRGDLLWVLVVAYSLAVWPCGALVGRLTQRWRERVAMSAEGLPGAGLWIGRLERVLVVTFVLLNRFEAIGFLIAAKSILRIGEVTGQKDRSQAEYILVGTMVSLLLAIAIGLAASWMLR